MQTIFFASPGDFRGWLEKFHTREKELWVGYYKKATGMPSITWPESVDEALCFGWIDGLRKSIDEKRYKIRFTPRRPKSHWSDVNIKKMELLQENGKMTEAGLAVFKLRSEKNSGRTSYEQKTIKLDKAYEKQIKADARAWEHFKDLAPSYKKATVYWIMSAKREATRQRRLHILIESSREGQKIPLLRRK